MRRNLCTVGLCLLSAALLPAGRAAADEEHHHYDIAPHLVAGELITGGLSHAGDVYDPPITVYGYEFGEDAADPWNPYDPGVNQKAGAGDLPGGSALAYVILDSLLYWDGVGEADFGAPPGTTEIVLWMGAKSRTITGSSGAQDGGAIQTVLSDGSVHKHFTTALHAGPGVENVPGYSGYVEPANGIYAFCIALTLDDGTTSHESDPVWMVFNKGLGEDQHGAAMAYFVPEPTSLALLALAGLGLLRRRR